MARSAEEEVKSRLSKGKKKKDEEPSSPFIVSTGSTLLDLAISGRQFRGGGIPCGILVEIYGPSGYGKTTLVCECGASAQGQGGTFGLGDVEQRISPSFATMMGLKLTKENYFRPTTVKEVEELILNDPIEKDDVVNVLGFDSIAALLSDMDQSKSGDKRGSSRAKELHQLCRNAKGILSRNNRLVIFTNQIQDVQDAMPFSPKEKTPGGHAVPFYASLRIRIGPARISKITNEIKFKRKNQEKVIGINSLCTVTKSSIDEPHRSAEVPIIFNYGIDDLRANLQWLKSTLSETTYGVNDDRFQSMDDALAFYEENNLESTVKEEVINTWEEIQKAFDVPRKPKVR